MHHKQFTTDIQSFLKLHSFDYPLVVNYSDHEDFQYQSPILFALKKDKRFVMSDLMEFLDATHRYEKVNSTGPGFLSVKFHPVEGLEHDFGDATTHKPQTVIVDYCGVNVAKQMHIGHIRSMFIGDFIVRAHSGDDVVIYNHIGDWGNQFGFLLAYLQKNKLGVEDNKLLTQHYKAAYKLYNEDSEFQLQAQQCALRFYQKDPELIALWKQCIETSLVQAQDIFRTFDLKISRHHTQGESFYAPFCERVEALLVEKNIAQPQSDGSLVAFFPHMSPLILKKSSGSYLYAMYDLAAIEWRMKHVAPDKIIYVVDKRQALHFQQVFDIALRIGWVKTDTLKHIGFGTILGRDKKPLKTKSGESLYLDELLAQGHSAFAASQHMAKHDPQYMAQVAEPSVIGALKFYDLKFNKQQDYIFDWEHVLNTKGNSAPYLQNAYVRIDSIFHKKFALQGMEIAPLDFAVMSQAGKNLYFNCQKTHEIMADMTLNDYPSHLLTQQLVKVCQMFHSLYEQEKILSSPHEANQLALLHAVSRTITQGCNMLGIALYPCSQKMALEQATRALPK